MAVLFYYEKQETGQSKPSNQQDKMDAMIQMKLDGNWWLSCHLSFLSFDRPRQCVTCGSPSWTGVMLGLADGWFHHIPLGWRLTVCLHFFCKLCPYHSYQRNRGIDKSRERIISRDRGLNIKYVILQNKISP